MDFAFLGTGALGGIGLVAALVMAIVMDGGKAGPSERDARGAARHPRAGEPARRAQPRRAFDWRNRR